MKVAEFDKAIRNIPRFRARFQIQRVPPWIASRMASDERDVEKGEDFFVYRDHDRTMVRGINGHRFVVVPSALRFIGYEQLPENHIASNMLDYGTVSHE